MQAEPYQAPPSGAPMRSQAEIDRLMFRRLMPILICAYVVCFLDRSNIAMAKVHLQADLGISAAAYGFGAGLFFLTYSLCEVPSNLLMHRFGARFWITRIMVTWGLISGCMALIHGPTSFYALRLLLGVAEAGFFPGVMLYMANWFRPEQRARANGLLLIGVCAANGLGGPVGGALLELNGALGLHGWQWLFIVEAVPALVMAAIVLRFMPDHPRDATWLTPAEAALVARRADTPSDGRLHLDWRGVLSPQILLVMLIYFCHQTAIYTVTFFLPGIIGTWGKMRPLYVGSLSALPWLCALFGILFLLREERDESAGRWRMIVGFLVMAASLVAAAQHQPVVALLGFCVAGFVFFMVQSVMWTYPASWLTGASRAAGMALVNSFGLLSGFVGPSFMGLVEQRTGHAGNGLYAVAVLEVIAAGLVLLLRQRGLPVGARAMPDGGLLARSGAPPSL